MAAAELGYQILSLEHLHESPLNPRTRFDPVKMMELAVSIKAHGVLTPLLARPNAKGFEIAAGHRRFRAAKIAGVAEVPVVVRDMTDSEFLEILVVENDQREDVHPLEQAAGYKALMLQDGYDAKRIADRIGRSEKWVYDRIKLLQLTPTAQQLFLAGRMHAGHAILLARLNAKDQGRALEVPENGYNGGRGGLWQDEGGPGLLDDQEEPAKKTKDPLATFEGYKSVSVRELDSWIDEHVRFDATKADPVLFPAVVTAVQEAPKPLVPITRNHYIPEEARDGKVRTYGPASWKEATKPCPYAQAGIIVVGAGRGDILQVCLSSNRERCAVHWKKEKAEAEWRAKQRARGGSSSKSAEPKEPSWERERRVREAEQARYKAAAPAIFKALAAAVDRASLEKVGRQVIEACSDLHGAMVKAADYHPAGKSADSMLRHAAFSLLVANAPIYSVEQDLPRIGKAWGVDVAGILEREAPKPKPGKQAVVAKEEAQPKKTAAKK